MEGREGQDPVSLSGASWTWHSVYQAPLFPVLEPGSLSYQEVATRKAFGGRRQGSRADPFWLPSLVSLPLVSLGLGDMGEEKERRDTY